jgi:hypothetical protein
MTGILAKPAAGNAVCLRQEQSQCCPNVPGSSLGRPLTCIPDTQVAREAVESAAEGHAIKTILLKMALVRGATHLYCHVLDAHHLQACQHPVSLCVVQRTGGSWWHRRIRDRSTP